MSDFRPINRNKGILLPPLVDELQPERNPACFEVEFVDPPGVWATVGYAEKLQKQLKREVRQLLKLAEQADAADIPDGMSIAEELVRREAQIAPVVAEAKRKIEARVLEREHVEYEAKLAPNGRSKRAGSDVGDHLRNFSPTGCQS